MLPPAEQPGEAGVRVEAGEATPVDRSLRADERRRLEVAEQRVVLDPRHAIILRCRRSAIMRRMEGNEPELKDAGAGNGAAPERTLLTRLQDAALATPPPLVDAISSLYEHAIDRLLSTSERVTSAAEGKRLLAEDDDTEALADRVQRVVVLAVPILRTLASGARFTRVPWVLVASTAFSTSSAIRSGVREVQVIGSLVAHRLERRDGPARRSGARQEADRRAVPVAARRPRPGRPVAAAAAARTAMGVQGCDRTRHPEGGLARARRGRAPRPGAVGRALGGEPDAVAGSVATRDDACAAEGERG